MDEYCKTLTELLEERIAELRAEQTIVYKALNDSRSAASRHENRADQLQKQIDRLVATYTFEKKPEEKK
jgi:hypothetical protein